MLTAAWFAFGALTCWLAAIASLYAGVKRRWWLFVVEGALLAWVAYTYTLVMVGKLMPGTYAEYIYPITPTLYIVFALVTIFAYRSVPRSKGGDDEH